MEQERGCLHHKKGWWKVLVTIVASIIIFGLLIVAHEFGHFIVAKLSGVTVEEFAIGMGPRVIGWKKNETSYTIRVLPIGGYVKMLGEDEDVDDEGAFKNRPLKNRIGIIAAGPLMNFILAILLFTLVFYIVGTPTTQIERVQPGYPAEKAGILPGDRIVEINGEEIESWNEIYSIISSSQGREMEIKVDRDGKILTFQLRAIPDKNSGKQLVGISPAYSRNFIKAVFTGVHRSYEITSLMVTYLIDLITGHATTGDIVGPVGIIHLVNQAAKTGILNLMFLAGILSLNLGVINLVPIPALDGSRLIFLMVEGIRGKPIDVEKEGLIHFIGFIVLLLLMVLVAYRDIIRFNLF